MTTGTEGNDSITNDVTLVQETIDALGGDDVITLNRPNGNTDRLITVNGGAGFDTLIINANTYTRGGATGFDGGLQMREGSSTSWRVTWTSIERLEVYGGRFFNPNVDYGDEIDIIHMTPGFGGTLTTGGGNDEIYFSGLLGEQLVRADGGSGNDIIDFSQLDSLSSIPSLGEPQVAWGGEGNDILRGTKFRDQFEGGTGNDVFYMQLPSPIAKSAVHMFDYVRGDAGNDIFFFGGVLTQYDIVRGGADYDTLVIQGNYAGGLTLSANVIEIEALSLLAGTNTTLGEPGTNRYDYVITTNDANFAANFQAKINGANLAPGEDFTFNGSAETDGSFVVYGSRNVDTLTGGFGNDIFFFAEDRFAPGDTVNGGPGGYDGMFLRGNYTIDFNAPGYHGLLTSIENITLTSATDERYARGGGTEFDYAVTLADAHVGAGVELTVSGALLMATETMVVDGSLESDGRLRLFAGKANDTLKGGGQADLLLGNLGADQLTGNGGADVFRYDSVADSNNSSLDHVLDFTPGTDKFDLSRIDANTAVAGDQAFTWIGSSAFTGVAGQLRAENLNNMGWFLEGDTDGNGSADFVVQIILAGQTPLGASDFIL